MRVTHVFPTVVTLVAMTIGPWVVPAYGDIIVLPNANALAEGDLGQSTLIEQVAITQQTVFAASQLSTVPLGSLITGMAFRLDGGAAGFPASALTWAQYDVQLSSSANAPGALSSTFASNVGANAVTVRSGPLTIPAGAFSGGATPNLFGLELPLTTPFVYNGGNLLITIRHSGNGSSTAFLDAQLDGALNQSIAATSATATTASTVPPLVRGSPIVRLTFAPIPEPSSVLLLVLGALLCSRRLVPRTTAKNSD
jgi:hypothetical protein